MSEDPIRDRIPNGSPVFDQSDQFAVARRNNDLFPEADGVRGDFTTLHLGASYGTIIFDAHGCCCDTTAAAAAGTADEL